MGLSVALLAVFIIMGTTGSYVAIENIGIVYYTELAVFSFFICWSIYSVVRKLPKKVK